MNAYELAEQAESLAYEIPADWSSGKPKNVATDIANMLRQQADRIAELEKQGKPVAWMNGNQICPEIGYEATIIIEHPKDLGWIPLYTTPQTKPLSDADIQQISHRYHYTYNPDYVGFARAIEERHGIK